MGQKGNGPSEEHLQDCVFIREESEGRIYLDKLPETKVHQEESPNFDSISEPQGTTSDWKSVRRILNRLKNGMSHS